MPAPPFTLPQSLAILLTWLGMAGEQLRSLLIGHILDYVRNTIEQLAQLAALFAKGRDTPRIIATPSGRAGRPRRPNPLPQKFGRLRKPVPDSIEVSLAARIRLPGSGHGTTHSIATKSVRGAHLPNPRPAPAKSGPGRPAFARPIYYVSY